MNISDARIRYLWRTKYPWILIFYILAFGIIRGVVSPTEPALALNLMMAAAFTSYIFLYIFYVFGVRPVELEYHFRKR